MTQEIQDIIEAFDQAIHSMSDAEFKELLAKVRPLREHSISVEEYLAETACTAESSREKYTYTYSDAFETSFSEAKDLNLAA